MAANRLSRVGALGRAMLMQRASKATPPGEPSGPTEGREMRSCQRRLVLTGEILLQVSLEMGMEKIEAVGIVEQA